MEQYADAAMTNHGDTHARALEAFDEGTGEALLLLHAFPLDARMWAPQREAFARTHRVIAPDLPGFGRTQWQGALPRSLDEHADLVAAMLDERGVARATVVGVSLGGYVALALARRHRGRVAGIVLADARATPDTPAAREGREKSIAQVREGGVGAIVPGMLEKLVAKGASEAVREQVRSIATSQLSDGVIAMLGAMRDRPDSTPLLASLAVPARVILGAEDVLVQRSEAETLADGIPGAKLVVIEGAGHLPNLERPADFNAALRDLLADT